VVVGEAAATLAELFCARWRSALGEELVLPAPDPRPRPAFDLSELTDAAELPLSASKVFLSRTASVDAAQSAHEIRAAYELLLLSAERIIYIETQYFTSRSIAAALLTRMRQVDRSKLQIVVALPRGADSGKEKFALGEVENLVLGSLERTASETGHSLRFLCSATGEGQSTTFIHSKVLVVDDEFLSIGSANLTERSMGLDSELALFWHADGDLQVTRDIARIRASLLAEHAGRDPSELLPVEGLVERIDAWLEASSSRLRRCRFEAQAPNPLKTLIFDPGGPTTLPDEAEVSTTAEDRERLSSGSIRLRRALARRSRSDA
jgi:phosphatidylserine/phosphatidylglycerophosphate/cardiolipin synthase-like enzyme